MLVIRPRWTVYIIAYVMNELRKPTSKRMRFEVFKRDNFECQYCGAKPPKVPLEIDHIVPVSKNGKTTKDNLITACFDCNRGKSNIELEIVPPPLVETMERKRIAQEQYLKYKKILKKEQKIIQDEINEVEFVYSNYFGYYFTDKFKVTVKKFIKELGLEEVILSIEKACSKIHFDKNDAKKYFCGICWNKIKGGGF